MAYYASYSVRRYLENKRIRVPPQPYAHGTSPTLEEVAAHRLHPGPSDIWNCLNTSVGVPTAFQDDRTGGDCPCLVIDQQTKLCWTVNLISKLNSWRTALWLLLVTGALVSVSNGGLTTLQICLLLILITLAGLAKKGNRIFTRKLTLVCRDDVGPLPFGGSHNLIIWTFGPIFILSALLPWLTAILIIGVLAAFAVPIGKLANAGNAAQEAKARAMLRIGENGFDVIFYASGPRSSGYQINQWIPVAERMKWKSAICVRKLYLLDEIDETAIPVYYAAKAEDIEALKNLGRSSVFLYPANWQDNAKSLRHAEMQHYFINHGESDKSVNQSKFLMAYDKLLVAGPMAKSRLEMAGLTLRENQVEFVGRPQLEIFLEKNDQFGPIRKVLYAPTWEGFVKEADYSSVSNFGLSMLESLLTDRNLEVNFKPHPFTGSRSQETKAALEAITLLAEKHPNLKVLGKDDKIYPQMNWCDLMIADIGSVVNDFLATGKPIILTSVQGLPIKALHASFPTTRGTYVIETPEKISDILLLISKHDPVREDRQQVRKDSLGDFPEGSLARFEDIVQAGIKH